MSRAYRISVKESVTRVISAGDEISTRLELLEILAPEAMAQLLREELLRRQFTEQEDGTLVRKTGNTTVTVDPCNAEVSVRADAEKKVQLEGSREATAWNDVGPTRQTVTEKTRTELKQDLEKRLERQQEKLQESATEELEKQLHDLQPELSEIVNKITREALKQKANQLGSVTEISEDDQTGSMTIKIEL